MNISTEIAMRILELCDEKHISLNKLSIDSEVSHSTLNAIVNKRSKNVGTITVKKICDGLNITVKEFFNSSHFENLEQDIY